MLPFSMTIPATVPQGLEILEGVMNNPVYWDYLFMVTLHEQIDTVTVEGV
jgi:hypothetical protein